MKGHEADTGESIFCQSKCKKNGHVMKDSLIRTHMYSPILICVVKLHLSRCHRKKCTQRNLMLYCSCSPLLFPRTQADGCIQMLVRHDQDEARALLKQGMWRTGNVWRTLQSDGDRAWLACTASYGYATLGGLASPLMLASLREAQLRTSSVPLGPFC